MSILRHVESHDIDLGASRTLRVSAVHSPDGALDLVVMRTGWYRGLEFGPDHSEITLTPDAAQRVAELLAVVGDR